MVPLPSDSRRRILTLAGLVLALAALVVAAPAFVLAMAPAIALFALFAHRIMPGADAIVRLRSRFASSRRPRAVNSPRSHDTIVVRRTGRLLAAALAMRPPPTLAHLSH